MKNIIMLLFFIIAYLCSNSQPPYVKAYNVQNYYNYFGVASDGSATVCGTTYNGISSVLRLDKFGNVVFANEYPGSQSSSRPLGLPDGSFLVGMSDKYEGDTSQLMLIDSNGAAIWAKQYYAAGEFLPVDMMLKTTDKGYLIASGGYVYFRINEAGNIIWSRKYGENDGINKIFNSLNETSTGYLLSRLYYDGEVYHLEFIHTDLNGEITWINNQYLHLLSVYEYAAYHVDLVEVGEAIYACMSVDGWNGNQLEGLGGIIQKLDLNGNLLSTKQFTVPGGAFGSIGVTFDCKYRDNGNFIVSLLGLNEYPGPHDAFIFSIDTSGIIQWSKVFADSAIVQLDFDSTGNMYFLLGSNDYTSDPLHQNIVVARVNNDGEAKCAVEEKSVTVQSINSFPSDVSPWAPDTISLKINDLVQNVQSFEVTAEDECLGSGIGMTEFQTQPVIFPNPADEYLNINLPGVYHRAKYELYDINGIKILKGDLMAPGPAEMIPTDSYEQGIYLLHIFADNYSVNEIIIIQH